MDLEKIKTAIKRVIRNHISALTAIGSNQSKLLELASITGFAEHYKAQGFTVTVRNPKGKRYFAVKTATNGDPWNFSRFICQKEDERIELHMNLKVRSAHDQGMYCVDVGVVQAGAIPFEKPEAKWECLPNNQLISFGEAKKLVVYPMLLAQFVGIVHEILPAFLNRPSATIAAHPFPTLIALGNFSGNANTIVANYPTRNIAINIAQNYDVRLARIRGTPGTSPFYGNEF